MAFGHEQLDVYKLALFVTKCHMASMASGLIEGGFGVAHSTFFR